MDLNTGHISPQPNNQTGATWGQGEGRWSNNGPREKGIVASRCKNSKGTNSGAWGANHKGPGAGSMEKGIVVSRGLSQITKLGPPGSGGGATGQQLTSGKGHSCLQT